MSFIKQGQPLM